LRKGHITALFSSWERRRPAAEMVVMRPHFFCLPWRPWRFMGGILVAEKADCALFLGLEESCRRWVKADSV
jgi:hypothetical protein